jgi:hypothetical protein
MKMTAAKILQLNGNMQDSPLMEVVRRFHALSSSRKLPYCVIGGMAVIRNGYARTTMDVDILTYRKNWEELLPLQGDITSQGSESCVDNFSREVIQSYDPAVREHCVKAFETAERASKSRKRAHKGIEP